MRAKHLLLPLVATLAITPGAAWAASYTYKVIHDFCSERLCHDGESPASGLIADAAGHLYGTTAGGTVTPGNAYELIPNADRSKWKLHTMHVFGTAGGFGYAPLAPLILDTSGNLYGTTSLAGSGGGTVFELIPKGNRLRRKYQIIRHFLETEGRVLHDLSYAGQASGALYDGVSPLYGSASGGGANDGGTIFRLVPSGETWTLDMLYHFCAVANCLDGSFPDSGVTVAADGSLVGATRQGGPKDDGVLFKLEDAGGTWTPTTLYKFCSALQCADGFQPLTPLADVLGNLYGAARQGGAPKREQGCCGVLYTFDAAGTYAPLYAFCSLNDCRDGDMPSAKPIRDATGTLYGTTRNGGGHNGDGERLGGGTVYAFDGSHLATLYRFCALNNCRDGAYPVAPLIMDADGNFFGTTQAGGAYHAGVVFELSPTAAGGRTR